MSVLLLVNVNVFIAAVSAHLDRSLKIAKEEIEQQADSTLTRQKSIASEVNMQL